MPSAKCLTPPMVIDKYLTHYWPICLGSMTDQIRSAHMSQGALTSFTTDRFGKANSALALNGGWTQVPPGIYFNSPEFTLMLWLYPQTVGSYSRIIDFGSGAGVNNVLFALSFGGSIQPYVCLNPTNYVASTTLTLGKWQFLVATFGGNNLRIYKDGQIIMNTNTLYTFPTVTRTRCYVGKSNWNDGYSNSILDDLRIYNKSLNQSEIIEIMNQNETG
jgi:hypothetical protein